MILRHNNSSRLWTSRVCDLSFVSFTSFLVLFGEKIVSKEADKALFFWDWFLFNLAKNISTIDLVVDPIFLFLFYDAVHDFLWPINYILWFLKGTHLHHLSKLAGYCDLLSLTVTSIVVSQPFVYTIPFSIPSYIQVCFIKASPIKARLKTVRLVRIEFQSKMFMIILKVFFFSSFPQKSPASLVFLIGFLMFVTFGDAYSNQSKMLLALLA